ncbi:hypothetical protein HYR99_33855 [Candidatus Poribacteria bacterium]|nr:hypothetical protein [Candidatus Poribacteria bacterium]
MKHDLNSYPIEKGTEKGMKNLKIREAVDRGLQKHKEWDYGKGYRKEVDLGSGNRADAVKIEGDKDYIKELKPNNPRAIKKGERQLERYKEAAKKRWPYVKEWQTEVVTYD